MPERTLLSTDHAVITLDEESGIVKLVRLETPFAEPEEAARMTDAAFGAIRGAGGRDARLLVDMRRGPGRNDPDFERTMYPHFARHLPRFARIAVVVRSAAGRLQLQRLMRAVGVTGADVFFTEEEARAFLLDGPRRDG